MPAKRPHVRRHDPPSRPPDGVRPWDKLENPDPKMHYVFVDPNSEFFGIPYYEALGYEQVLRTDGGVRSVMKTKGDSGSVVTSLHQVLMQIPLDEKRKLDDPGQRDCDEIDKRILKPGGVDGLRGKGGYLSIVNETDRNRVETRVSG